MAKKLEVRCLGDLPEGDPSNFGVEIILGGSWVLITPIIAVLRSP